MTKIIKEILLKINPEERYVLTLFVIWRLAVTLIAVIGTLFVPAKSDYVGGGVVKYYQQPLFWGWANFDGVYYLKIAKEGYFQYSQAFFPFYPETIRLFTQLIHNYLISGLFISHFSLLIALFLMYRLIKLDFKEKIARRSLFYLLIFPTSFYLGSIYTESLFLALSIGCLYASRKKHWMLAGVLGAFASATRLAGIFLLPALLIEYYQQKDKFSIKDIGNCLLLLVTSIGLLSYMLFLQKTVRDPLYFMHVQPLVGAERTGGKIILLYQVFWRYIKMIFTTRADILYLNVWSEFITAVLFFSLAILTFVKLRLSYFVYFVLSYLTPTLTGTFSSLPRYVLVIFPGFIILSLISEKRKWLRVVYSSISILLLVIDILLFTRGFFVA